MNEPQFRFGRIALDDESFLIFDAAGVPIGAYLGGVNFRLVEDPDLTWPSASTLITLGPDGSNVAEVDDELLAWLADERSKARTWIDKYRAELVEELPRQAYQKAYGLALQLAQETAAATAYLCITGVRCGTQGIGWRVP